MGRNPSIQFSSRFAAILAVAGGALLRIVSAVIATGNVRPVPEARTAAAFPAPCRDEDAHWTRVSGLVASAVETAHAVRRVQAAAIEKIDAADYALAQLLDDLEMVLRPSAPALMIPLLATAPMPTEPSRIAA